MKALVMVAHPDDCVIFASAYMDAHPEHDWHIAYLTHHWWNKRAREIAKYWRRRGITTQFLGFKDHGRDLGSLTLKTWPEDSAIRAVRKVALNYELILTHGEDGEYGHPHHQVVHKAVKDFCVPKVYFSLDQTAAVYPISIALAELPRHTESILIHAKGGVSYYKGDVE